VIITLGEGEGDGVFNMSHLLVIFCFHLFADSKVQRKNTLYIVERQAAFL
jgi:hypothetical protein